MAQRSARQTALAALRLGEKKDVSPTPLSQDFWKRQNSLPPTAPLRLELFYGVLRNLTLARFLDRLSARFPHRDRSSATFCDSGLYQLFMLKTPEHAAVHETV